MKHLKDKIYEGLLGGFEQIEGTFLDNAFQDKLNDPDGPLSKYFSFDREERSILKRMPVQYVDNILYLPKMRVMYHLDKGSLSEFLDHPVDQLHCACEFKASGWSKELSPKTLCKELYISDGAFDCQSIKDMKIILKKKDETGHDFEHLVAGLKLNFGEVKEISNTTFEIENTKHNLSFETIPTVKNVKGWGNITHLRFYSPFLFDEGDIIKAIEDNWLELPYTYTYDGDKEVVIKNFKKLHAVVNNKSKYRGNPIKPFKENINASDVIPWINDFDFRNVCIENNNVQITLSNSLLGASGSSWVPTQDGWYIRISKK